MIHGFERRQRWIETHPDWIPCKLPHFAIKENAFYFLASEQPAPAATLPVTKLVAAIDGNLNIESVASDRKNVGVLAQLWASGIVTFVPPSNPEVGPRILAIEPHPDDVALSAGGALLLRRDTARKTILSVASRSNATFYMATPELRYFDIDFISDLRKKESLLAARFLRARYQTLGEPDITVRYIDPERYTKGDIHLTMRDQQAFRYAPPQSLEIDQVSTMLWETILEISPDEIWMPLGLGNHFDHRLTRDACLDLICRHWSDLGSAKIMFYEDLPYAWDYPGTADVVVRMLRRRGANLECQSINIDSALADKIECLRIYASQLEIEKLRPVVEGYARMASSTDQGYAETLWWLTRPPFSPFAPLVVARGMPGTLLEDSARQIFEHRASVRRLGLLIGNQICQWRGQGRLLLELFPNAHVTVLASNENRHELSAMDDPRLRLLLFDQSPWSLLFSLIKWVGHFNDAVLIFGGPRWAKEAGWLSRMLPSRYAYAFENLQDMCGLWRYWLEEERGARLGEPIAAAANEARAI